MQQVPYPVQFSIDFPDRALDRVSTAFRIFAAVPILIVLGAVAGGNLAVELQRPAVCRAVADSSFARLE